MRDRVIDHLKGLGILLMVFVHAFDYKVLRMLIYPFHMPLFFMIDV